MDPAHRAQGDTDGRCRKSMPLRQEKPGTMAGSIPARRRSRLGTKIYRSKDTGERNAYPDHGTHHRIKKTNQEMRPETALAYGKRGADSSSSNYWSDPETGRAGEKVSSQASEV